MVSDEVQAQARRLSRIDGRALIAMADLRQYRLDSEELL